eukprot:6412512-Pyramimonas_sp.AAC.1
MMTGDPLSAAGPGQPAAAPSRPPVDPGAPSPPSTQFCGSSPSGGRQRDLFPLPALPVAPAGPGHGRSRRALRRRQGHAHGVAWANDAIAVMNSISPPGVSPTGPCTSARRSALEHVAGCCRRLPQPSEEHRLREGAL